MVDRIKTLGGEFTRMRRRLHGKSKGALTEIAKELIDKYGLPAMDRLERRTLDGVITWYAKNVTRVAGAWGDMVAWIIKDGGGQEDLESDLLSDGPIALGIFAPDCGPALGTNENTEAIDILGLHFP
jgi:hypothetical protein